MDALAVGWRWLLKCVKLWEPESLRGWFLNLPIALYFTSLDRVQVEK